MLKIRYLILLVFLSCSTNNSKNRIDYFENILGEKKSEVLTKTVNEFESKLLDYYQTSDLKIAYYEYFKDISEANYDFAKTFGENWFREISDSFQAVHLEQDIILRPFDVKNIKGVYAPIYVYYHDDGTVDTTNYSDEDIIPIVRSQENISTDSLINRIWSTIDYNLFGKWFKALNSVKANDSIIINYLEFARLSGIVSDAIEANYFLYIDPDINDYFVKRIILVGFLY